MPSIAVNPYTPKLTPNVLTYIGATPDRGIVCQEVNISPLGSMAEFDAPVMFADQNKMHLYTQPITVYAADGSEGMGAPIFRGYVDTATVELRGERVSFTARSVWYFLRDMKMSTPQFYSHSTPEGLTTQSSPIRYFLSDNPYTYDAHETYVWQPGQIAASLQGFMDSFWQSQVAIRVDPSIPQVLPVEKTFYRVGYNGSLGYPVLSPQTRYESPFPDIIFRSDTTFGQALDMCVEMAPGTQVFEVFTSTGTDIWLAYPQSFGAIIGTAGSRNNDWRDSGANIIDLDIVTSNGVTANRITARASAASCMVTLMSETGADGPDGYAVSGLVPDWPLFEDGPTVSPGPGPLLMEMHGVSAFNYATGFYELGSSKPQTIRRILDNPYVGVPGSPDYIQGYEDVGRRYRLPNWFEFADIERKNNVLVDARTGENVDVQVFAEIAATTGNTVESEDEPRYYYMWVPVKDFVFDQDSKSVTLGYPILTNFIDPATFQPIPERGKKLARIALTFTYSHPSYTLAVDSYIDAGGQLPPTLLTAIPTGQIFDFECTELGYTQISNIGMPLISNYAEVVPWSVSDSRKKITPQPRNQPAAITYNEFLLSATTDDGPNTYNATAILPYVPQGGVRVMPNPELLAPLVAPMVLRDDSDRLRLKCRQQQYLKGRRARRVTCRFNQLVKYARRGMTLGVQNVQYMDSFAGDIIDSVTHDLIRGETTIYTNNQPADETVRSVTSA